MERINFKHLDIPIIRSCNLDCFGCITHSNHKNIKGLVNLNESIDWMEFWATKLDPNSITIFGGEPLLHPDFVNWAKEIRRIWGSRPQIKVNTNGYYLDKLIENLEELFNPYIDLSVVISIQTGAEPYRSTVKEKAAILKDKIYNYRKSCKGWEKSEWVLWDDTWEKFWYNLEWEPGRASNLNFVICEMHKLAWCTHYTGYGETMLPVYDYNDIHFDENHKHCQARDFVTLYKGKLYKCPPIGVLEHTLSTFGLTEKDQWSPYLANINSIDQSVTDHDIATWFDIQNRSEKLCNMCGFSGPNAVGQNLQRSHYLKTNWKVKSS